MPQSVLIRLGKYSNGEERIYRIITDPDNEAQIAIITISPIDGEILAQVVDFTQE